MGHADLDKQVRRFIAVFIALLVLTGVTVAISYLHLSTPMAIGLALLVASVKGTLVAGVFMHLFDEKKLIYVSLVIAVVFFFVLLLVPVITQSTHPGAG